MATSRGRAEVERFLAQADTTLRTSVLRGAARAAAKVVAEEAKLRSISPEVSNAIKIATRTEDDRIIAKVQVKGPGAYIAPWIEYGTDPHFIRVDPVHANGMSARRVNQLDKEANAEGRSGPGASLIINGKFVGATVHHPGATPHPFLRPALDAKEGEAIAAAQGYINSRVTRAGIIPGTVEPDE